MPYLLDALGLATGLTQLGTVLFLLAGPIRKYAFVLAYSLVQLLTSLLEVLVIRQFGTAGKQFRLVFWTDEIVLDLLLFSILILLTFRAMEGSPARASMGRVLAVVTSIVVTLPFFLFKGAFRTSAWFDHASQVLNFGGALLNLGLWTALLSTRRRDEKLLTVSAGFGIMATGAAISFGLRRIFHGAAYSAASDVFVLAHLAGSCVLCFAFRPALQNQRLSNVNPLSTRTFVP